MPLHDTDRSLNLIAQTAKVCRLDLRFTCENPKTSSTQKRQSQQAAVAKEKSTPAPQSPPPRKASEVPDPTPPVSAGCICPCTILTLARWKKRL
jgi:hypothetical protein